MNKQQVYPLFSAPLYVNNVGDFERPDLSALEYSTKTAGTPNSFLTSVDKNVLDRPEFARIREIILTEVDLYAREILFVSKSVEFYITNSWLCAYGRGSATGPHIHHNSLISGVLYLQVTETSGGLVFHHDVLSLIPFPPTLDLDMDAWNIFNCKSWSYKPKTNDICLFPSVVSHSSEPNDSDEQRWCLPFNVFVKGNFGALHKLTIK